MKSITLPVGFRFADSDLIYEVVEDKDFCKDCAFIDIDNEKCLQPNHLKYLVCSAYSRDDNCEVVFKLVGYVFTSTKPNSL